MKDDFDHKSVVKYNSMLNASQLITQYYNLSPDPDNREHDVVFGTSGHRGSAAQYTFNESHVLAITQSIVNIRIQQGIAGPCYVGKDTHILSEPAFISVLEVLAANSIDVIIEIGSDYTPTPVISHSIIYYNQNQNCYFRQSDGIIITSSHNPPEYGGIKYNSIFGGPARIEITKNIELQANRLLAHNLKDVRRITLGRAWSSGFIHKQSLIKKYVIHLSKIIDMRAIKSSELKLGVDPLSGASVAYWQSIAQHYQLDLTIVNERIDKTFSFIHRDYDGCIRIDCSSSCAMQEVLQSINGFDLFFVNDPDCDRYGIITSFGLLYPNYYLSIAANYLFLHRLLWSNKVLLIGKSIVSSTMIDYVAYSLRRRVLEAPVGFKWFTKGLFNSTIGLAGEESAGASFLDCNGNPWSTDKDGLIMCLLAAEIVAVTNCSLQEHCDFLKKNFRFSSYNRIQIPVNRTQKSIISSTLFDYSYFFNELVNDPIISVLNISPLIGQICMIGIKITTRNGWVACRLSGTESIYKIYCESFLSVSHRCAMEQEIIDCIYTIMNNPDLSITMGK